MRVTALSEMDIENVSFQVVSSDGHIHSTADITGASITIVDKRNKEFEKLISATAAKYLYLWLVERNAMLLKRESKISRRCLLTGIVKGFPSMESII